MSRAIVRMKALTRAEAMYQFYEDGRTLAEVGKEFGCSGSRIGAIFRRYDWKIRRPTGARTGEKSPPPTVARLIHFSPAMETAVLEACKPGSFRMYVTEAVGEKLGRPTPAEDFEKTGSVEALLDRLTEDI